MRKILLAALAAAVLVVLFASAQGTAAFLRAQEQLTPGTITTGRLALEAGNGATSAVNYTFAALNTAALLPGGSVQAPLTISNTGEVNLDFALAGAHSATVAPTAADTALAAAVVLTVHAVTDSGACSSGVLTPGLALYQGQLSPTATFSPRLLTAPAGQGSAQILCVRLSLPSNAASGAAGGSLALVLTWRGDQS